MLSAMDKTNTQWLQEFFLRLCDGDWEHGEGFKIESLDNPGWWVEFSLEDTKLLAKNFERVRIERSTTDWLDYWLEGSKFRGTCGPGNLDELLAAFRAWVDRNLSACESPWADTGSSESV